MTCKHKGKTLENNFRSLENNPVSDMYPLIKDTSLFRDKDKDDDKECLMKSPHSFDDLQHLEWYCKYLSHYYCASAYYYKCLKHMNKSKKRD